MSAIFARASRQWAEMKTEYDEYVDAAYDKALDACEGVLVNQEGKAQHIDGYSLLTGSVTRAYRFASWELKQYWTRHPRITLAEFEEQWITGSLDFYEQAAA